MKKLIPDHKLAIVYHNNCSDGYTSFYIAQLAFPNSDILVMPTEHNTEPKYDKLDGVDLLILDFSFSSDVIKKLMTICKSVSIYDHHVTSIDELKSGFGYEDTEVYIKDNLLIHTRLDQSGALITYNYLDENPFMETVSYKTKERTKFVNYVSDRDLWTFNDPDSKPLSFYIFSFPYTIENWSRLIYSISKYNEDCVSKGIIVMQKHFKDIDELSVNQTTLYLPHFKMSIPICAVDYTKGSDMAGLLANNNETNIGSYITIKGNSWYIGLRSVNGVNVSDIAKYYGGGGHDAAAAMTVPFSSITGDDDNGLVLHIIKE